MSNVVNLRRARRALSRAADADAAAVNRLRHGLAPAIRRSADAERERCGRQLDALSLQSDPPATPQRNEERPIG